MGKKTNETAPLSATKSRPKLNVKAVAAKALAIAKKALPAKASLRVKAPKLAAAKTNLAKPVRYTESDVALRAYFIAENRHKAGLPGDPHQDWVEAERQLAREAGKRTPTKLKKTEIRLS